MLPTEKGTMKLYVVGVYHYDQKRMNFGTASKATKDIATPLLIPYTYAVDYMGMYGEEKGESYFQILTSEKEDATALGEATTDFFNNRFFANNENFHFESYALASQMNEINNVLLVLTLAVSLIAGISLLVGGVGVMNIMLISVVERTREIGLRKALGAKNRNIRLQFLVESVVLCLIGGILGILIGLGSGMVLFHVATALVASYAPEIADYLVVTVKPSIAAILISVGFSAMTGIVFGYYPANRAAQLKPIDALRYE